MSGILGEYLGKLQLDDAPGVASKAAQFFDQLGQRLSGARHGALAQCRPTIAIHLACESLSTEFNEVAARSVSSMSLAAYQACLKEARVLLNIRKHVTLEELDVQFGPPAGIIDCARQLLGEFERTLGGSMPAAVRRNMNWADSAYVAGAFFLVCKHFKKRVVAKADLLAVAAVKPAVFSTAVDKLTQFGKATLADIDQGRVAAPKTPGKRRRESQPEPPAAATPTPTPRGRRAAAAAAAPVITPPAELDSVSRKRVRRTANASPPGTESVRKAFSTRLQLQTPPAPGAAAAAAAAVQRAATPAETPVARKRGRPRMTAAERAAKAAVTQKAAAAAQQKKAAEKRLRIGMVSMIKDQDYRTTQLYADYQQWKATMLKA